MVQMIASTRGPASLAQQGIWVTERTGSAGSVFHMPLGIRLDGPLDVEALLGACDAVLARHPALSSALQQRDGALQVVEATRPVVAVDDLAGGFELLDDEELHARVRDEVLRPFDLTRGPLARLTLLRYGSERYLLLVVVHHAVFDGISKDVLVSDLAAAYEALVDGRRPELGPAADPTEQASAEQERVAAELPAAAEFWKPRWRRPEGVVLPGQTRPPRGAVAGEALVSDALRPAPGMPRWQDVTDAAQALGVTRFELLLAGLHALLHRYGNARPVVAVDLSTRTPATDGLVGVFVNELPVFSEPTEATSFRDLAWSVRGELRALNRFRAVPLARAVGGITPRAALTPVSLSYRRRGETPELPGVDTTVDWAMFNHAARNALHVQVVAGPDQVTVSFQHDPETVGGDVAARTAEHLATVLRTAARNPDVPLTEIGSPTWPRLGVPAAATSPPAPAEAPPGGAQAPEAAPGLAAEITAIWQEVLQMDEIGPDDDLFDLGGHSLTITQIIARTYERLGIEMPLEEFFETPTIKGMVAAITRVQAPADAAG